MHTRRRLKKAVRVSAVVFAIAGFGALDGGESPPLTATLAAGGAAVRITDIFNDARQPAWSPDGKWITFFAYRDGGYDLWSIAPDGSNQHRLTVGPFDDREPIWSHDGTQVAFSSDRGSPLGSDCNIWVLEVKSGALRQLTHASAEDYMPSWSPDDAQIAFVSTRENRRSVWAVDVATGAERKVSTADARSTPRPGVRMGEIVYHVQSDGRSRLEVAGRAHTGDENAFPSACRGHRPPSSCMSRMAGSGGGR